MSSDLFIDILVKCFERVGLICVKRSPIRLEVLAPQSDILVGEVFFIRDDLDASVFIANDEYEDLFEGIVNGMRIGFKEGVKWQTNQG